MIETMNVSHMQWNCIQPGGIRDTTDFSVYATMDRSPRVIWWICSSTENAKLLKEFTRIQDDNDSQDDSSHNKLYKLNYTSQFRVPANMYINWLFWSANLSNKHQPANVLTTCKRLCTSFKFEKKKQYHRTNEAHKDNFRYKKKYFFIYINSRHFD